MKRYKNTNQTIKKRLNMVCKTKKSEEKSSDHD